MASLTVVKVRALRLWQCKAAIYIYILPHLYCTVPILHGEIFHVLISVPLIAWLKNTLAAWLSLYRAAVPDITAFAQAAHDLIPNSSNSSNGDHSVLSTNVYGK